MAKARKKPGRKETLWRYILVTECRADVHCRVDRQRGRLPSLEEGSVIEFVGTLHEPLDGVDEASVMIFPTDHPSLGETSPLSVGSVLQTKPSFQAALHLGTTEFARLWALAAANQVKSCFVAFTQPYRRHALILSISLSTQLPENE